MSVLRKGSPAWMTTFADLMALLTTFFILLLSMSQIDAQRYKHIAGSMERAFGVQWLKQATDNGSSGNIIGDHPPSMLELPQQQEITVSSPGPHGVEAVEAAIREQLAESLAAGLLETRVRDGELIISFRHEAAFESGSEVLVPRFRPIIARVGELLGGIEGRIHVAGHTDDVPIDTYRFRSNWELASARAVSVVHALLDGGGVAADRLVVEGYADTRPVAANDTPENRARNRRVEIRIRERDAAIEEAGP